jgi:hypothetical protein
MAIRDIVATELGLQTASLTLPPRRRRRLHGSKSAAGAVEDKAASEHRSEQA